MSVLLVVIAGSSRGFGGSGAIGPARWSVLRLVAVARPVFFTGGELDNDFDVSYQG